MNRKTAIIIGAGPAGLTAAHELLEKTDVRPVVYELSGDIGGIAKTVNYKGNRIDIGGHRFFSKSDRVMEWWQSVLPLQGAPSRDDLVLGRSIPLSRKPGAPDPEKTDGVMLLRSRLSRIFHRRKFFDYPISLNVNTLANLGLARIAKIGASYAKARFFPIKEEKSLEDFFINRFGRELYLTFFKDYTEKVWGVTCKRIKPEWGSQRVKGLSLTKAVLHALKKTVSRDISIAQKGTETSLIDRFMYPKYGPGQLWEEVARRVRARGGEIHLYHEAYGLNTTGNRITEIEFRNKLSSESIRVQGDYFLSSMPVRDLVLSFRPEAPEKIRDVARGLVYRDFITVGLLLDRLMIRNETNIPTLNGLIPDNWIYVQESNVKLGRIQVFNNWSPYLVKDSSLVWLGLEYFCSEGDEHWGMSDEGLSRLAVEELMQIGIIRAQDVRDSVVIRMQKTYPAYFGSYDRFNVLRDFTDDFANLFLIGRNGMHRYNNMDHSMLTAMAAVDNIREGVASKMNIWAVNTEEEYHEA